VIGTGRREPSLEPLEAAVLEVIRITRGQVEADRHARRVAPFQPAGRAESRPESRAGGAAR
jgi:hypothetical protein